jgi:hypothetical protein
MALDIFKSYNKKVAAQLDAAATVQARRQIAADDVAATQTAAVESMRPINQVPVSAPKVAPAPAAKSYWPYAAGAAAVLALLFIMGNRR